MSTLRFWFSILTILLFAGCAVTNLRPTGSAVSRDLSGVSELCVVADAYGFDEVALEMLLTNDVPAKIASDCELTLESSASFGRDIGRYVTAYRARVYLSGEKIGDVTVTQPNNTDLGKFSFSDQVQTAIQALNLFDKGIGTLDVEVYNIDLTRITVNRLRKDTCHMGDDLTILVEGQISPDSSFAMSRLLERLEPCRDTEGQEIKPISISLRSGGGLLQDGYLMGQIFRQRGVTTVVENGEACASSCAVAFLGGVRRIVEDDGIIMYHAPYFSGENVYGKRDIDCEIGDEPLNKLSAYYREMTDAETGDRLFERTMWYCSAEDGWVVTGGSAAELFGIATEK